MNSQRLKLTLALAAVTAAGVLSACTSTVDGQAVASSAAGATPETTLSNNIPGGIGDMPEKYRELGQAIASATNDVVKFWKTEGVDLSNIDVKMVDNPSHAPCTPSDGTPAAEAKAWTCPYASPPSVVVFLPAEQNDMSNAGPSVVWFTLGHELGHMASYRRGFTVGEQNNEALADCLAGAAAAGDGNAGDVLTSVADLFGQSSERFEVVQHGVDVGADACFVGAR